MAGTFVRVDHKHPWAGPPLIQGRAGVNHKKCLWCGSPRAWELGAIGQNFWCAAPREYATCRNIPYDTYMVVLDVMGQYTSRPTVPCPACNGSELVSSDGYEWCDESWLTDAGDWSECRECRRGWVPEPIPAWVGRSLEDSWLAEPLTVAGRELMMLLRRVRQSIHATFGPDEED